MRRLLAFVVALLVASPAAAQDCAGPAAVCPDAARGAFELIGHTGAFVVPVAGDEPGVREAAQDLAGDLLAVDDRSGKPPREMVSSLAFPIVIATLGHNREVDRWVREGKLDVRAIRGRREAFVQQVIERGHGTMRTLVIVGSDRRGTIYGVYDLSRRIGVSPWHWWADVPVRKHQTLFVRPGARADWPRVTYRGIFLNDEDPSLKGWAAATFGGLNHAFYERVFKLILRLRGNYLWPAMWGKSLWDDDPESAALASRLGIVLGTSHHEPLLRAHVEWERYGKGPWDYAANAEALHAFWREGMVRNAGREAVVTVGMRGDGDKPMTEGTAIPLLERIVADQRRIIAEVTGRPASQTPQLWALYKEVQDYYDKGMRVPDDVTLLFSDDNWGNIRRLPEPGAKRAGGYGVYYHFDYVGGPRNYKWIDTVQIARVWEQMSLAHAHGADRIWIANVGDLKPMELPISFFLDMAWNPAAMTLARMTDYHRAWAAEQFGPEHAAKIGDILDRTTRYLARRKPELIDAGTWSLDGEADRVVSEYQRLAYEAEDLGRSLPAEMQDAYYELVLYPALAAENLNLMYVAAARNHAVTDSRQVDAYADEVERRFARDRELARAYEARAGGKWIHMMDQVHIGYTGWQQPPEDVMPAVRRGPQGSAQPLAVSGKPFRRLGDRGSAEFLEADGVIAIEAEHFERSVAAGRTRWIVIPGLGRTLSAVTPWPQIAPSAAAGKGAMLEYAVELDEPGEFAIDVVASPSLDTSGGRGLRYAISIDAEPPQVVDLWAGTGPADWARAVSDSVRVTSSTHRVASAGRHVVRLWMIDPGVVIQRLVLHRGALPPSYLGPVESERRRINPF